MAETWELVAPAGWSSVRVPEVRFQSAARASTPLLETSPAARRPAPPYAEEFSAVGVERTRTVHWACETPHVHAAMEGAMPEQALDTTE
jgi:hypothetical protein